MPGCLNRLSNTSILTTHVRGFDRFSNPIHLWNRNCSQLNFLHRSRQVRMTGCRIKPQDTPDLTWHACGTDSVSYVVQSNLPLDPKLFSRKFFCVRTSSNVWMSHQASRSFASDITCTWHGQAIIVPQIQPTFGSPRRIETKNFPSEQVQMSGCRIKPRDPSHRTLHACGTDRVSCVVKSNTPLHPKTVNN